MYLFSNFSILFIWCYITFIWPKEKGISRVVRNWKLSTHPFLSGCQCYYIQKCRATKVPDFYICRMAWWPIWITLYGWNPSRWVFLSGNYSWAVSSILSFITNTDMIFETYYSCHQCSDSWDLLSASLLS